MPKVRTTLTIDEEVMRAVRVPAARTGRGESEIVEQALRRDLGLDLLERIRAKTRMPEDEARALAVEARRPAGAGAEVRAVHDPNVLISGLLSPSGTLTGVLRAWIHGDLGLVISPRLLGELERALALSEDPETRRTG
jgi:hypothetical protein